MLDVAMIGGSFVGRGAALQLGLGLSDGPVGPFVRASQVQQAERWGICAAVICARPAAPAAL